MQGLDDAFQQAREAELDEFYDPSDPSDRQQIEWRRGGGESPPMAEEAAVSSNGVQQGVEHAGAPLSIHAACSAARQDSWSAQPLSCSVRLCRVCLIGAESHQSSNRMEGQELSSGISETTSAFGGPHHEPQMTVASQLQKDAFLVFRALCKLSIRSTDAAAGSELTTIRGKVRGHLLVVQQYILLYKETAILNHYLMLSIFVNDLFSASGVSFGVVEDNFG